MKEGFLKTITLCSVITGCGSSHDTPLGNGFLLRGSGMTGELHPAVVSLHLKKDARVIDVWPALTFSAGGPLVVENNLLFCARNQMDKVALFVADERGVVADITPSILREAKQESEVQDINDAGDKVRVELLDSSGGLRFVLVSKSELVQFALKCVKDGEKVRWGSSVFYR